MKISKIEAQQKTPGRYSVFIDGVFAFGLSEAGLLESGLQIGQEISNSERDELKHQANLDKAYNQSLALIARRPRSRWEIAEYLKRKSISSDLSSEIISKLDQRGFIDDLEFARRWVESRRLLKSISKRKLALELRAKRVSDEIVNQVLQEDQTDELEVIKQAIVKKQSQSRYQDKDKLIQYLARQGYNYEDIKQVLADNAG